MENNKVLLVVLDGFGINPNSTKNAVESANTPHFDYLKKHYPYTTITAGGEKVGLPKGVIGNSEVGHMNLGAGKPVRQDLVRINEAIEKKQLANLKEFQQLISTAKNNNNRIHLIGLLSDGGVHSHIDHLKAIYHELAKEEELDLFYHAMMDGRDTAQDVGKKYIKELANLPRLKLASVQGRSIGMDRDRRWEKIERSYKMMTGQAAHFDISALEYIEQEYLQGRFDEFINPALLLKEGAIKEKDCIFFLNFRPDRAIQITLAFCDPNFKEFQRSFIPPYYLCMTPYVPEEVQLPILFDKERIEGGLSEFLSQKGLKQYKIAETEKYAHVTYFFNGGFKTPYPGEDQVLIPSPRDVQTYDERPEMSAFEVSEKLLAALDQDYHFYLVNYANCDMVGHTGNYQAAVKAVETVDQCLGKLIEKCRQNNITMIVTADHGNSDEMVYPDGSPHTSHSNAPVPFIVFRPDLKERSLTAEVKDGALMDVAPTVLEFLQVEMPENFIGQAIFKNINHN